MTKCELQAAVRSGLAALDSVTELKMFGGIGFLLNGHMVAGASQRGLMLRTGRDRSAQAVAAYGARPMEMRGRVMADYIMLDIAQVSAPAIDGALALAVAFVRTLPPKDAKEKSVCAKAKPK